MFSASSFGSHSQAFILGGGNYCDIKTPPLLRFPEKKKMLFPLFVLFLCAAPLICAGGALLIRENTAAGKTFKRLDEEKIIPKKERKLGKLSEVRRYFCDISLTTEEERKVGKTIIL